jgi:hypothetical protein
LIPAVSLACSYALSSWKNSQPYFVFFIRILLAFFIFPLQIPYCSSFRDTSVSFRCRFIVALCQLCSCVSHPFSLSCVSTGPSLSSTFHLPLKFVFRPSLFAIAFLIFFPSSFSPSWFQF